MSVVITELSEYFILHLCNVNLMRMGLCIKKTKQLDAQPAHLFSPRESYTAVLSYLRLFICSVCTGLILITITFDKRKDERVDKLLL